MPLLTGEGRFADRELYWHFPAYLQGYSRIDQQRDPIFRTRPVGVVRDGKWKLHEYFEDGDLELYDLAEDPGESHNLLQQHPDKAAALHAKLLAWREKLDAPTPIEANPAYDAVAEAAQIKRLIAKGRNGQ